MWEYVCYTVAFLLVFHVCLDYLLSQPHIHHRLAAVTILAILPVYLHLNWIMVIAKLHPILQLAQYYACLISVRLLGYNLSIRAAVYY